MKTLKLALLVTTAAGAVTAGGVTYAAVGNSTPAPSAQSAKGPVANPIHEPAPPAAPGVPTCLPNLPKGAHLPKADVPSTLPKAPVNAPPAPGDLPKVPGNLPKVPGNLPKVPGNLPKVPGNLPKVPGNLPTCAPNALPKNAPAAAPNLPSKPDLPAPGMPSCSSVPPAIKVENARAKDIALPNGMHLAFAHAHSFVVHGRHICANSEKFVAAAGKFLTVERLNTPPQVTLQELAQGLKLPEGKVISVGGVTTWQSPLNGGMLWYSDKGYALYLTGSPEYTPLLPGIASQLRTQ